jgi:hypothetical protein
MARLREIHRPEAAGMAVDDLRIIGTVKYRSSPSLTALGFFSAADGAFLASRV